MGKMIDLTNQKFGRLTVIAPSIPPKTSKSKNQHWLCQCICGNQTIVNGSALRAKLTTSCGCLQKERVKERSISHGMTHTRLYGIYAGMKKRCGNSHSKNYKHYGERGISICPEWLGKNGFQTFAEWAMANGYSDELSIDRIDVNKGYSPENCRWVNSTIQNFNQRMRSDNTSGHTGVEKRPDGKYVAQIPINRKRKYLGVYPTLEEAIEARERAEREFYPELFTKEST